ncbi:tetratricopeptide repeat protein [Urechidicola vernalis]|uniref:Tetratricopeptide repeat protein n=1 Tax=Urechidicola vernalis TaxID=3075600 RepID=A0ABU2Y0T1_9FLAO|nr:hypothetical protein [Urechidicola sp. P050]MDT0551781.1 hypothetical protein [Urechidicola sp. P050]
MKMKFFSCALLLLFICSCGSSTEDPAFLNDISGRYLFNADEELEIYIENDSWFMKWRGATKIKPLKVGDGVYFVKEMNEKIQFRKNPTDNKYYICLVPKTDDSQMAYDFMKLEKDEFTASYYLKNGQFNKALEAYKSIKSNDSLSPIIEEAHLNRMGYRVMNNEKNMVHAISIFKLNAALHPESDNVYDSLGEALLRNGDTLESITNYKKSLEIDSGNRRAQQIVEKYGN